jgi:hypothetical protein
VRKATDLEDDNIITKTGPELILSRNTDGTEVYRDEVNLQALILTRSVGPKHQRV